ncbi:MAG: alpha,2-mannosyltransferase [Solirubrobacteraceae bacterium]|jgi:hypothetical protein|nr:alpha,2-mannosyltransferase [Solirubrobacteraceae bacterium]
MTQPVRELPRPLTPRDRDRTPPTEDGAVAGDDPRRAAAAELLANCVLAARRLVPIVLWGVLPLAVIAAALAGGYHLHYAGDFHYSFWPAGQRVLHGSSPYVDPGSPDVARAIAFVYPAVGALLLAPFSLLPRELADAVFTALNIAAVPLMLRVLGVRDWRLYGASLLCLPVLSGWLVGNVTLFLALGIALLWRHRDRPLAAGLLAAVLVSFKLFLWPLCLWLLATRRYAAFAWTMACGVAINVVAWGVLGFDEIGRYRRLLHALADQREDLGYSVVSVALREGLAHGPSYVLAFALAGAAAAACMRAGRRGREHGALALAVLVCLLATPIVQLHYFALLLVPLALARPRLGVAWLLPLALWACSGGLAWQAILALASAAAIVAICLRDPIRAPQPPSRVARTRLPSLPTAVAER